MFYGLIVSMYYLDNRKHHLPHIHVRYQKNKAIVSLTNGEIIQGKLPKNKLKLLEAWIEIHKDELLADWELAVSGENIFKIDLNK